MRVFLAALLLCAAAAGPARAYTAEQRAACEPDARRLCTIGQLIEAGLGHYGGIIACFRAHRLELSRECVDVIRKGRRE